MRVIALTTQKGGSGKSTLASSLAVAAHEAGEKVFIVDMDPQGSLTRWAKERGRTDQSIGVEAITLPPAKSQLVVRVGTVSRPERGAVVRIASEHGPHISVPFDRTGKASAAHEKLGKIVHPVATTDDLGRAKFPD